MAEELGAIRRSVINKIPQNLLKYAASSLVFEEEMLEDIGLLIGNQILAGAGVDYPALRVPDEGVSDGDCLLGYVMSNGKALHPFLLREDELLKHVSIFGSTGTGKTNLCMNLLIELCRKKVCWMVLDWKKNYRDLLSIPDIGNHDILVLTIGEPNPLRFNPLVPPEGTGPKVWLKKLIEIICTAYYLGEGVAYLLMKAIDSVYRDFGVYEGSSNYPTFKNIIQYLENLDLKGRSAQWKASTLRALANLTYGELGDVLCTASNLSLPNLLKRNVIIELHKLTSSDKKFLVSALLLWIYFHRLNEGRRETLKHVLVLEEAHHIAGRKFAEISGDESVVELLIREIRELGEGVILIDQTPSLLSKPILGNTYCTICLNLKERSDINLMARILQIDSHQKRFLSKLEVGQAIVKLQGRFTDPFMIKAPFVKISKGSVTDEDIKKYYAGSREIGDDNARFQKTDGDYVRNKPEAVVEKIFEAPSEGALKLLTDIASVPLSATTERYRRLGMNRYQGNKARKELEGLGLIKPVNLPGRDGGYMRTYELTEKGEKLLRALGHRSGGMRRGGILHQYIVSRLCEELRARGLSVEVEKHLGGGRTADLVINGKIAVEVEITKTDLAGDLEKNFEAGLEKVVFLCAEDPKSAVRVEGENVKIFRINELERAVRFISSLIQSDNPSPRENTIKYSFPSDNIRKLSLFWGREAENAEAESG
ncbi:MAG: DUF87 domain-containing protein [Candidatus Hadarchaeales archaeon]